MDPSESSNRRRSKRVVLRVPLRLSARTLEGKRITIDAQSLAVNAHGGLLDVGIEMLTGQEVLLSNLKTENVTAGKVLRVEGSGQGRFLVAFEFQFPTPNFWPVSFPPPDWTRVESSA
jgi:hypothetical protein